MDWDRFLSCMSESEFNDLSNAHSREHEKRLIRSLPDKPEATAEEKNMYLSGRRVDAIQAYRDRTGILDLRVAMAKLR